MKKINVLEVSQTFPDKFYELGTFVKESIDSIAKKKQVSVEVLSPRPHSIPINGLPFYNFSKLPVLEKTKLYKIHRPRYIYPIPKKLFYWLTGCLYAFSVNRYIKKQIRNKKMKKPGIIHAQFSYPDGYAMMKLAKHLKIPLIVHARGTLERKITKEMPCTARKIIKTLKNADKIIAVSNAMKKTCIELGINPRKIEVVENGVNIDQFKPMNKKDCRKRLNLPETKSIVLYVGNLKKIKGVDYLVDAAKEVLKEDKEVLFCLCGDGELKDDLIKRCQKYNIQDNFIFAGQIKHNKVATWINAADFLVLPSRSEGRPNIPLEAMACKKTTIATNVGGTPEVIKDNYNGILVKSGSVNSISRAIKDLLKNSKKIKTLENNCPEFIRKNSLSWQNHSKKIINIYKKVLE
ncbi:glycosyltransferase [Nanoarchaeota archaeon]